MSSTSIVMEEPARIPLAKLPQQAEARGPEDDWSGLRDSAERRKIQNRLNQRTYRRRRREKLNQQNIEEEPNEELQSETIKTEKDLTDSSPILSASSQSQSSSHSPASSNGSNSSNRTSKSVESLCRTRPPWMRSGGVNTNRVSPNRLKQILSRIDKDPVLSTQIFLMGSPHSDQLLTLIHFNVFRALVSNTSSLGFTMEWLDENAISPFGNTESIPSSKHDGAICPRSLQPSLIQKMVPHHPWIDLLPFPKMRDNMLLNDGYYDEYDLCNDLVDFANITHENTGLIVWSEPWDPMGWEMSERFANKWKWVFKGCEELMKSTNAWRVKRGEPRITFEEG